MQTPRRRFACILFCVFLSACTGIPKGVEVIDNFELNNYLGLWYEIARLDHRFERDLTDVTANYSLREDGGVKVVNRGYNTEDQEWQEAIGKAYFNGGPSQGRLKVSFFGPFYGGYNIVELDQKGYQWSMVVGPDRSYLWILSRTPDLDPAILDRLTNRAAELGFPGDELIFVTHERRGGG